MDIDDNENTFMARTHEEACLLEEYRSLREEMLLHLKLERQILALSGSLFFLILNFLRVSKDLNIDFTLYGVILQLSLLPLYVIFRVEVLTNAKIASYIQVCIEPKISTLSWTGLNIKATPEFYKRAGWGIDFARHFGSNLYFLILLVLSWFIPLHLKGSFFDLYKTCDLTVFIAMVILSLVYLENFFRLKSYIKKRKIWVNIWEELCSAEKAANEACK